MTVAVDRVLLVHGYSVRALKAYAQFPRLLTAQNIPNQSILLSAFLSLDDEVTCDDLAAALEDHVATEIEARGGTIARTAVVCHSTGAIVTRRWILNRQARGKPLPSHLITFAGANHGSTLAQLGRTILSKLYFGLIDHSSVGANVLTDLDYGSAFLWKLNTEWLTAANAGLLDPVRCFSLGGDNHSEFIDQVFWQTHEAGSDSTVRVSGANLNYAWLEADPQATPPRLVLTALKRPAAHLILPGYTHSGIIGGVNASTDPPFAALLQALAVGDDAGYAEVLNGWRTGTDQWTAQTPDQANSTIIFRLRDSTGRPVNDNLILFQDQQGSAAAVSTSLEPHQPIQNAEESSSISFYVNFARFMTTHPHTVHIEARSGSPAIDYKDVDYTVAGAAAALVKPNECTYVDVQLSRDVDETYSVVPYDPTRDVNAVWPPLPP